MFLNLPDSLLTALYLVIFACATYFAFEYFHKLTQIFDPGALVGIGVVGCIAALGFNCWWWDEKTAVVLCLLGGCFGSGIYRWIEMSRGTRPTGYRNGYR